MKIVIITYGTRGDTQPFVALADELNARGHETLVCGAPAAEAFVRACGIEFASIGSDFEIFEIPEVRRLLREGRVSKYFRDGAHRIGEIWGGMGPQLSATVKDADVVVSTGLLADWAWSLSQKYDFGLVFAYTFPFLANGDYANMFVTSAPVPTRIARRMTHSLFNWGTWRHLKPLVDDFRQSIGLDPASGPAIDEARGADVPCLHMWSETIAPRPRDWRGHDVVTGYFRFPSELRARLGEGEPPAGLAEWLAAGPEPVFFGFGGTPIEDADAALKMVSSVAAGLKLRIVCSFGGRVFPTRVAGESTFVVKSVDHDWLFPRCAAAVHHGGAGTTGASLMAGTPSVVCSVFADQPFWGKRVAELGVGVHLPFAKLNESTLRDALERVTRPDVRARARELAAKVRGADGIERAIEAIEYQSRVNRTARARSSVSSFAR